LAGNSLAEAVVFGRRAAVAMASDAPRRAPSYDLGPVEAPLVRPIDPTAWDRLRAALSRGAGLVRTEASLAEAEASARDIAASAPSALRTGAIAAELICRSGRARDESRGAHFRADAVNSKPAWEGRHVRLTSG
jgi:L-aspartate oxidase